MSIKGLKTQIAGLNTGKYPANLDPALIRGMFLVPYGFSFAVAASDDDSAIQTGLLSALKAALTNDSYQARAFHIGPFESFADKTDAPTEQTLGYGKKVDTHRGNYNFDFGFDQGGFQYHQSVMSFKGKTGLYKCLFYDDAGTVYGTNQVNSAGVITGVQGIKLSRFYPNDWKFAEKDKEAAYMLSLSLADNAELNENLYAIDVQQDVLTFAEDLGIQDVTLELAASATPGEVALYVRSARGGINLTDSIPGVFTSANFSAKRHSTGATITVTGVTILNGAVKVQLDTADADYLTGAVADVSLKAVSVLATAGYKYYEGNSVSYTMS